MCLNLWKGIITGTLLVCFVNYENAKHECFKYLLTLKSNHRRCSTKKDVFKNFAKFAWKHLCQSLYFNKIVGLNLQHSKETLAQVLSCEFCSIFINTFFTKHLQVTAPEDWKLFRPLTTNVPLEKKEPVNRFEGQINRLVSIWRKHWLLMD